MLELSQIRFAAESKEGTDDPKEGCAKNVDWKALMAGPEGFLRPLIQEVVQQVLEAELLRPDTGDPRRQARIAGAAGPPGPVPDRGL
jgi:hypothetical protein